MPNNDCINNEKSSTDASVTENRAVRTRKVLITIYKAQWSLWTSIYRSKTFTKYSVYSLIAYAATNSPVLGAISFNCTLTALSLFNYIRIWFPDLFAEFMKINKERYGVTSKWFHLGDIITHGVPFALSIKWLPNWYPELSKTKLVGVSSLSLICQIGWAYFYASGMDVSAAYDMEKSDAKLTGRECKRIWIIIGACHFIISGIKGFNGIPSSIYVNILKTR